MMTCDDVQLALVTADAPLSAEVEAHLSTCATCRQARAEHAEVLALAAPPPVSAAEQVTLNALPAQTLEAWRRTTARRSTVRRFGGLALAAGLGAVVASGVFVWREPAPKVVQKVVVKEVPGPERVVVADLGAGFGVDDLETLPTDDDENVEVSWPQLNEGDAL